MILVPRSLPQALSSVEILRARGFSALSLAISEIVFYELAVLNLQVGEKLPANLEIIITSQNALACAQNFVDFPLHIVGEKSAQKALDMGFVNIKSCSKNAEELLLVDFAADRYFLYLRGEHVSTDIVGKLQAKNLLAEEIIVYSSKSCLNLPIEIINAWRRGEIKSVIFYSSRMADVLVNLLEKHDLLSECAQVNAFCLSDKIAQRIKNIKWNKIIISAKPSEESIILELEKLSLK